MAIGTYGELVQAIQDWMMDRSDLAAKAPDFIAMGEGIIAYGSEQVTPLRCREMEAVAALVPASGVCALPSDYLQYRRVVDTGTPRRNLGYVTPEAADLYYPGRAAGTAEKFTIVGADLQTFPLTANTVELTYYARVPALTALAATNWLLQKHPGIYLRASLLMAAEFIKDAREMATQATLLSSLIKGMNDQGMLANYAKAGIMPGRSIA
jgi:hypothetical protein